MDFRNTPLTLSRLAKGGVVGKAACIDPSHDGVERHKYHIYKLATPCGATRPELFRYDSFQSTTPAFEKLSN